MNIEDFLKSLPSELRLEITSNTTQKPHTHTEKAKIEKKLLQHAEKFLQQGRRTDLETSSKHLEKVKHGKYDLAARIMGESHETIRQREKVFNTIKKDPKLKKYKKSLDSKRSSLKTVYDYISSREKKQRPTPDLPEKEFEVIYADPPWEYGSQRQGFPKYKTMRSQETMKIKPPATKNCILFMWVTNPQIPAALALLEHWGFTYKTKITWVKTQKGKVKQNGIGYYVKGADEMLWICTRGEPGAPLPESRPNSVIFADEEGHSKKPRVFARIIEKMYPAKKKLEMFAREKDPDDNGTWEYWGDELNDQKQ